MEGLENPSAAASKRKSFQRIRSPVVHSSKTESAKTSEPRWHNLGRLGCKAVRRHYTSTATTSTGTTPTLITTRSALSDDLCSLTPQNPRHCTAPETEAALHPTNGPPTMGASFAIWNLLPDDILRRILHSLPTHTLRPTRLACPPLALAIDRTLCWARPERLTLATMPNLRTLDLSCCGVAVDWSLPARLSLRSHLGDGEVRGLAHLHRLETLSLKGCVCITGTGETWIMLL